MRSGKILSGLQSLSLLSIISENGIDNVGINGMRNLEPKLLPPMEDAKSRKGVDLLATDLGLRLLTTCYVSRDA